MELRYKTPIVKAFRILKDPYPEWFIDEVFLAGDVVLTEGINKYSFYYKDKYYLCNAEDIIVLNGEGELSIFKNLKELSEHYEIIKDDFKLRLVEELKDLALKCEKLTDFLSIPENVENMELEMLELLNEQLKYMLKYKDIIKKRLMLLGGVKI